MKKEGRYDVSDMTEGQAEPGSSGKVLKNRLHVKNRAEMDQMESEALMKETEALIESFDSDRGITKEDICRIHKDWLGNIYEWAGSYRQVLMSKGNFTFAAPIHIPNLMEDFEKKVLSKCTPCNKSDEKEIIRSLALVHVELLLIHPFRDGNGRLARLIATLMALQAGLPPLDFGLIKGKKREEYFAAVRAGMEQDYSRMEKIFSLVIKETLKNFENY